jgi:hypothetical protein
VGLLAVSLESLEVAKNCYKCGKIALDNGDYQKAIKD